MNRVIVFTVFFLLGLAGNSPSVELDVDIVKNFTSIPLVFTENQGQWDEKVMFRADAGGATMWFTPDGAYYQFNRRIENDEAQGDSADSMRDRRIHEPDSIETMMIKASFVGANSSPAMHGVEMIDYKCNYFIGNDQSKWASDVPNYQAVVYEEVYEGIDLKYYGNGRQMEYDFIVSPGADFSQIKIQYEGAESVTVNDNGELVVATLWGDVVEQRPVIYQVANSSRIGVGGEYSLKSDNSFGFELNSSYDPALPLVIDPVLSYSTYLGGSGTYDSSQSIAVDATGATYVSGYTDSTDFPALNSNQGTHQGGTYDAFITKLSGFGGSLVYSTYLGGSSEDYSYEIAIDDFGDLYLVGHTRSIDFPLLNPYQGVYQGGYSDVFVTKLSSSGNSLVYSTYLGGNGRDYGYGIAVDSYGAAYVTGFTGAVDFPTLNPYQGIYQGGYSDVFVTKLNSSGNNLVYSTYLGGSDYDYGHGIAVDFSGVAYVTGPTLSVDFPTLNSYQGTNSGDRDAFVAKLSSSGNSLVYSTYLGGSEYDTSEDIAIDASGAAFVTGETFSNDFPTLNPYQGTIQGDTDAFVTKLSSSGSSLVYSTFLGGSIRESGASIAIDASGAAYVTGNTLSSDFPTLNAFQGTNHGGREAFVAILGSSGSSLFYSTYLGGNGSDSGSGLAIDASGSTYVTGYTRSADFPMLSPYQGTYNGMGDAFVAKFTDDMNPQEDWPDNPGPSITLRIEENTNSNRVEYVRLSGLSPTSTVGELNGIGTEFIIAQVENGYVSVTESQLESFFADDVLGLRKIRRVDLLGGLDPPVILGHVGYEYTYWDWWMEDRDADAIVYLHDDLTAMVPGNANWQYRDAGWDYYVVGEFPVSMLVPPQDNIASARGEGLEPVLFVHGVAAYFGDGWADVPERLGRDMYDAWRFYYPYDQQIPESSLLLGRGIEEVLGGVGDVAAPYSAQRIDLVAHSMGGLVARQYIQSLEYANNVNKLLMFGTPNHGSYSAFRMYYGVCGSCDVVEYTEVFGIHDAKDTEAPAYGQLAPGSAFIVGLNESIPAALGTGSPTVDYLVVGGISGSAFNQEVHHQDDGFVALSSASLVEFGVPLAVVDESHTSMKTHDQADELIEEFLSGSSGSFPPYVVCDLTAPGDGGCDSQLGTAGEAGILELQIPLAIDGKIPGHYKLEIAGPGVINLKPNALYGIGDMTLQRVPRPQGYEYFSRIRRQLYEWDEIGVRGTEGQLYFRFFKRVHVLGLPVPGKWDHFATTTVPAEFHHLGTTTALLDQLVGSLATDAPNSVVLLPSKTLSSSYGFAVDATIDTLVINLSSEDQGVDFGAHEMVLVDPSQRVIDPIAAATDPDIEFVANEQFGPIQYQLLNPSPGNWTIQHSDAVTNASVVAYVYAGFRAGLEVPERTYAEGDTITCSIQVDGGTTCQSLGVTLTAFYLAPGEMEPVDLGPVPLVDSGGGAYTGELMALGKGQYDLVLISDCEEITGGMISRLASTAVWVGLGHEDVSAVGPIDTEPGEIPSINPSLHVWPNPANPRTTIGFSLPGRQFVELAVYSVDGRRVAVLARESFGPGSHEVTWHGRDDNGQAVASGVYFARIKGESTTLVKKMVILK